MFLRSGVGPFEFRKGFVSRPKRKGTEVGREGTINSRTYRRRFGTRSPGGVRGAGCAEKDPKEEKRRNQKRYI